MRNGGKRSLRLGSNQRTCGCQVINKYSSALRKSQKGVFAKLDVFAICTWLMTETSFCNSLNQCPRKLCLVHKIYVSPFRGESDVQACGRPEQKSFENTCFNAAKGVLMARYTSFGYKGVVEAFKNVGRSRPKPTLRALRSRDSEGRTYHCTYLFSTLESQSVVRRSNL